VEWVGTPITEETILRHFLHGLLSSVIMQWNKNSTLLLVIYQITYIWRMLVLFYAGVGNVFFHVLQFTSCVMNFPLRIISWRSLSCC